jgi:transcriptional regulator with XRE-family HTH domain
MTKAKAALRPKKTLNQPKTTYDRFADANLTSARLGKAIREIRDCKRMKRTTLSEATQISESYLAMIEGGFYEQGRERSISFDILNRIAYALKVPTAWILLMAYPQASQGSRRGRQISKVIEKVKSLITEAVLLDDVVIECEDSSGKK